MSKVVTTSSRTTRPPSLASRLSRSCGLRLHACSSPASCTVSEVPLDARRPDTVVARSVAAVSSLQLARTASRARNKNAPTLSLATLNWSGPRWTTSKKENGLHLMHHWRMYPLIKLPALILHKALPFCADTPRKALLCSSYRLVLALMVLCF